MRRPGSGRIRQIRNPRPGCSSVPTIFRSPSAACLRFHSIQARTGSTAELRREKPPPKTTRRIATTSPPTNGMRSGRSPGCNRILRCSTRWVPTSPIRTSGPTGLRTRSSAPRVMRRLPVCFLCLALGSTVLAQSAAPFTESIREADLRADLFFLAGDGFRGRLVGTPENALAAEFVRPGAQQLRCFHQPMLPPTTPIAASRPGQSMFKTALRRARSPGKLETRWGNPGRLAPGRVAPDTGARHRPDLRAHGSGDHRSQLRTVAASTAAATPSRTGVKPW